MVTGGPACLGAPAQVATARRGSEWMAVKTPPATAAAATSPSTTKGQRAGARRAWALALATAGCRAARRRVRFATATPRWSGSAARQTLLRRTAGRRVVEVLPVGVRLVG